MFFWNAYCLSLLSNGELDADNLCHEIPMKEMTQQLARGSTSKNPCKPQILVLTPMERLKSRVWFMGSVQESGRDPDFSGVWPRRCQAPRRRRRCGNVGTRVWCGFPSAGEYPVWDSPRLIRRVISTATLQIRPILV